MARFIDERVRAAEPSIVAAVGYSNGANLLASVLFQHPELLGRVVLMHPLVPFQPPNQPGLAGREVLITAGRSDPIAPAAMTDRLAGYFRSQGAATSVVWHDGGHEIRPSELAALQEFLTR
jgi:phospholipase/carboxylesterase